MKLVRRARKSIRERRMKACQKDLSANLEKVEMRVFKAQKRERERQRRSGGIRCGIPKDVLQGKMNAELYSIECRLHREAGLPPPASFDGFQQHAVRRIGLVEFAAVARAVLQLNRHLRRGSQ
ncbi:hypothetical protein DQ04_02081090 [Trypanosoma grayi]|uniref:hypothetical protein n=1 Tax=Trypanosoma grayi TaxID=71804 RepID=UPI0004F3F2A4|nr:hypothetical protein DQ04_02081090 [Trypanosoma grayi]KEG12006.1 hypothetical protein DQ04_02081090 [Trypanosoma grayi]